MQPERRQNPKKNLWRIIRVGFLFLPFQFQVRLLQLIGENFQVTGQLVFGLELFGEQHQIARGIVKWNVAQI